MWFLNNVATALSIARQAIHLPTPTPMPIGMPMEILPPGPILGTMPEQHGLRPKVSIPVTGLFSP